MVPIWAGLEGAAIGAIGVVTAHAALRLARGVVGEKQCMPAGVSSTLANIAALQRPSAHTRRLSAWVSPRHYDSDRYFCRNAALNWQPTSKSGQVAGYHKDCRRL